jgi:HK97 family phage portal protein
MNPFASLLGRREEKVADASALGWSDLLGAPISKTGLAVNVDSALRNATALACVRVLAEGIAQLPLKLYREAKSGKKDVAWDHPVHWAIYRRPNAWQSSFEWRETSMLHAALAQGAHSLVQRVGGKVDTLIPLTPSAVATRFSKGDLSYQVSDTKGVIGTFQQGEIFCVRGPSWTSLRALEIVRQAAEAIGLSIAIEESQARLHANGVRPSGTLSTDETLTDAARTRLAKMFEEGFQGVMNAGKVPVLDGGLKFVTATMTGVDAQTLESRKHQIEEIARMFRVFPQMIGYADKTSTYASAEQFFIAHVVHSLGPWIERWEQAIARDLLTPAEVRDGYFAKFTVAGLLRGDATSRAAYFKSALGTASSPGWMSPNDVRRLEDLDPGEEDLDAVISAEDMAGRVSKAADEEDGKLGSTPGTPALSAEGAAVQDTALNGSQVASLLAIIQAVAAGALPAETARAMIAASFPGVAPTTIDEMLKGLAGFQPPAPPAPPAAEPAPEPDDTKSLGPSLERGMTALAAGLAVKAGSRPEIEIVRDAQGQVTSMKLTE